MNYRNPSPKHRSRLSTPVRLGVAAVAACFIAGPVLSNPLNPTVVDGTATFSQAGSVLTVTNSNGAIINWNKFSIGAGETTHFAQASASSSVLNRVLNDPTVIYGTLSSNGRVWLVNPAGIMVGAGGRVDVAGFVASTLNISNADFLAGRHLLVNDGSAQNIINQGEIRTPAGGSVYLIGGNVANEGIITTPQGETLLAAGATVSLIDSATPGVKVDITGAEGNATNLGTIAAEAGRIGIAGVIVRNSGTLNASSIVSEGGRIFLKASQDAYVDGNGRIVTTGTRGGSVEVLGNRVAVMDRASIDASGTDGGGSILVGGDYQGKNPDVQNANISYFGPNATLKADATEVGDGGTVIVWADDTTRAYGSISARGGALGGNGGLVETSGKRYLDTPGIRVDVGAGKGTGGVWLLDPSQINIVASGTSTTTLYGGPPVEFSYGGNVGTLVDDDINTALSSGASVIVRTDGAGAGNGNITAGSVFISGPGNLTLAAYGGGSATGNIDIYGGSFINLGGSFKALAGWNGATTYLGSDVNSGTGDINIVASNIQSGLNMDLHAGNDITLGHTTTSGAGTWIQSSGLMSVSANNLSLYGGSTGLFNISGSQGPGVMLRGDSGQSVAVGNQILLQAGSVNNTVYAGDPMAGGSVSIESGGFQDISAKIIKLHAGPSGHDSGAQIQAYGGQLITITGTGGSLEAKGGGDGNALVYGGAGSFNNQARVQHGQWISNDVYEGFGDQSITIYGGGALNILAGNGTGVLGYYGSDCYTLLGDACRGGRNGAEINNGIGTQVLDFVANGSLTITGGGAGTDNWAGVENSGAGQSVYGGPNITLTGGSAGGSAVSYGGETFELSNDAGIYSEGSGGQYITAGTLTIIGGNATYGGAGISNEGITPQPLTVLTSGDLGMYGGTSNAAHPHGAAVYLHSEAGGNVDLTVGGNLYVKAGSGTSTPAIIGSIDAPVTVNMNVAGNVEIMAGGSGVAIGSQSATSGAFVSIQAGGDIVVLDSATRGVTIGSRFSGAASPTSVYLTAQKDITIGTATGYGALIGVENSPSFGYTNIVAGSGFAYGGNLLLNSSSTITAGATYGSVNLGARQTTAANGNITQNLGSSIYGGHVSFGTDGNLTLNGGTFADGNIRAFTGYWGGVPYGGDVSVGGRLQAGAELGILATEGSAGTRGNITLQAGSNISAGYGITIAAPRNVGLSGTVTAGYSLSVSAGVGVSCGDGCFISSFPSSSGGDVVIGAGGNIITGNNVDISAKAGYATFLNGNITQSAGSTIYGSGVGIYAYGDAIMGGTLTSAPGNGVYVESGYGNPDVATNLDVASVSGDYVSLYSSGNVAVNGTITATTGNLVIYAGDYLIPTIGNINLGGSTLAGYGGVTLSAHGDVIQTGGSIASVYGGVGIFADNSASLGAPINAATNVNVFVGYNGYGGNLTVAGSITSQSQVNLHNSVGSILQTAGTISAPLVMIYSGTDFTSSTGSAINGGVNGVSIAAYRNVNLGGSLTSTAPAPLTIYAGVNSGMFPNGYGGDITLGANSTTASNADILLAAYGGSTSSGAFINYGGATALSAGGRWLAYSDDPGRYYDGGLIPDFREYGATGPSSSYGGNGVLFGVTPVMAMTLSGTTSRQYDGTVISDGNGLTLAATTAYGDSTTYAGTFEYDTRNAGTGKLITATATAPSGSAMNGGIPVYGLTSSPGIATAYAGTITPASLSISAITDSKTYDGTLVSTGTPTVTGTVYGGDSLTVLSQSFLNKNVLGTNGSTLHVYGGYLLNDGNGGLNYNVSLIGASGTITPASLNISAVTDSKTYDGTTISSGLVTYGGLVGGDFLSGLTQSYDSRNAGSRTLSVNGGYLLDDGNFGNNYNVSLATASGTITPASLSISAVTDSKTYDGTTISSGLVTYGGLVGGDFLSGLTQSYDSRNAGSRTLSVNGGYLLDDGNFGNNYNVSLATASGTISQLSSVAWTGATTGTWSSVANWSGGAIPDGTNVLAVSIPSGTSVTFDAANPATTLNSLSSSGASLVMSGSSLDIAAPLTLAGFGQTGGAFTASDMTVTQNFSQTGGTLAVSALGVNQASGNLSIINGVPLTLNTTTVNSGSLMLDNTGGITVAGPVSAYGGGVSLTAHSPITVNSSIYASAGDIALSATTGITLAASSTLDAPAGSVSATTSSGSIDASGSVNVGGGGAISFAAPLGSVSLLGSFSTPPSVIDSTPPASSGSGTGTQEVINDITTSTTTANDGLTSTPIEGELPPPPPQDSTGTEGTLSIIEPYATIGGIGDTFGGDTGDQQASEKKEDEKKSDEAKDEKKDEKPAQKKVAQCT